MTTGEPTKAQRQGEGPGKSHPDGNAHERRMYVRFGRMIATSTAVMFVPAYTNAFSIDHV